MTATAPQTGYAPVNGLRMYAVEMFRLHGGGVFGDLAGLPSSQRAILPGTTHVGMLDRADWLLAIVPPFLDAPMPGAPSSATDGS